MYSFVIYNNTIKGSLATHYKEKNMIQLCDEIFVTAYYFYGKNGGNGNYVFSNAILSPLLSFVNRIQTI